MAENPGRQTLVLGIGNTLMGDEGVGVSVVEHLRGLPAIEGVEYLDGGTDSFHHPPRADARRPPDHPG